MAGDTSIRCRQIAEPDLGGIADLLARGFPRSRAYWAGGLERLRRRVVPEGCPRFGFMLERGGQPVGAILTICQALDHAEPPHVRCNFASWYVDPEVRGHAALLSRMPFRLKTATFLNASPAPNTWGTIEAQGFTRYTGGQLFALPMLGRPAPGWSVARFRPDNPAHAAMPEAALLADHAAAACLSLVASGPDGLHPIVLLPVRLKAGRLPFPGMQLVYCRSLETLARFARPLGRFLLRIGRPVLVLDAGGPVKNLPGYFWRDRARKYFKGSHRPRLGDLAYTELTLFGP